MSHRSFSHQTDLHQALGYQKLMATIGWESIDCGGSVAFVRRLGPISFAKMQRPHVVDLPRLLALRREHRIVQFRLEPHVRVQLTTCTGNPVDLDLTKREDLLTWTIELGRAKFRETDEHYAHTKTSVFPLTSAEAFLARLPAKARYNIRTSYRRDVSYTTTAGNALTSVDMAEFDSLHTAWGTQRKIRAFDTSFVWAALESFGKESVLLRAYIDGEPVGALVVLAAGGVASYYYACTVKSGLRVHAAEGLLFEGIKWSIANPCTFFDFWSVWDERYPSDNPRWKGFTEFKSRFNPDEIYYPPSSIRGIL